MARRAVQSATALQLSPAEDRRKRMRAYSTAMSIRMACLILVFFVPGWWKLIFGIGAVILPYIAVVLANAGSKAGTSPISPGLQATPLALEPMPADPGWRSEEPEDAAGRRSESWESRPPRPQWQE